jgi:AcrR family transcriptional regulator
MEVELPRADGGSGELQVRRRDLARTRAALVAAASGVFARRGYAQASLDEIAEVAGFTRGAVHHHFSSKEELFLAVIAQRDEELFAGYDPDLAEGASDPRASAARWQELHGDSADEVALRLELRSHAMRSAVLRRRLVEVHERAVSATAVRLANAGGGKGMVWRHPVEQVAELFHAASHAAAERAALRGESSESLMAVFNDVIWRGAVDSPNKEE